MTPKPMTQEDAERIARTTDDPDFAQRAQNAADRNDPREDPWDDEDEYYARQAQENQEGS